MLMDNLAQPALPRSASAQRGFLRYVVALLNMCPSWVANLTSGHDGVIARSPTGVKYLFLVEPEGAVDEAQVLVALDRRGPYRLVMVSSSSVSSELGFTPAAREIAKRQNILLWSLDEMDYLVMAGSLESNAPLAHLGLEVELPRQPIPGEDAPSERLTQGF
ncbi:MAG: hypothetical protein SFU83_14685 [Meiothermus sp.]|nr:hypothetical protein [Meiothermus sp.]